MGAEVLEAPALCPVFLICKELHALKVASMTSRASVNSSAIHLLGEIKVEKHKGR